jgi:hypothetical protein
MKPTFNDKNPIFPLYFDNVLFKSKIIKQANFAEKDQRNIKKLINNNLIREKGEINEKKLKLRAYSALKYDFSRIFQYKYYTRLLKKMKKGLFFNLLSILEEFNMVFNKISQEFKKNPDSNIFEEKLVIFLSIFLNSYKFFSFSS